MRILDIKTTKRWTIEYTNEEEFNKHKEHIKGDGWYVYSHYITPYTYVCIYEKEV